MAGDELKRLHYYEGQFLRTRDFQDEQTYHISMRRRHNIAHHSWGIVTGLAIEFDETSETWMIRPGMAIDGFGREILLSADEPLDFDEIESQLTKKPGESTLKIWIAYREVTGDPAASGYELCDQPDLSTRVQGTFRILYADMPPFGNDGASPQPYEELPGDPCTAPWPVCLGQVTWDKDQEKAKDKIAEVDSECRRYVGLIAHEIRPPAEMATIKGALAVTGPLQAENVFGGLPFRIHVGQTSENATDWQGESAVPDQTAFHWLYVDVDTSHAGFDKQPYYIATLHGARNLSRTTGGCCIEQRTATGFRAIIVACGPNLRPDDARASGWHIQWMGIQME